jgi:SAM-dependent methyltransferase
MTQRDVAPSVVDSYEFIAEHHIRALDSVYNDYYERPVMYELLSDVAGKRVLDAGCGPGSYVAWLLARGAMVSAFDSSPKMVELARQRVGSAVEVRQADLNHPLDFLRDRSFDVVLSALVLDYVEDWDAVFAEFSRVLVPSGLLVISVYHPFFLDLKVEANIEDSYFAVQQLEEDWLPFGLTIPAYRRPLGSMAGSLWNAGFHIERIIEPRPTEACKEAYPQHYETLSKHPVFLCMSARKLGITQKR